jgi:DNA-binding transcriptional LysR family regulator
MLDRLEMFLALERERHFGRAAAAVGVAQPTLSAAIRALEGDLGVLLVRRGSRFEGLTPEGERLLPWARRLVADARALRSDLRGAGGLEGRLALASIPTALAPAARLAAAMAAAHPRVRVTVVSAPSAQILDGIEALTFDAGLSYLDDGPLGRTAAHPLYEESYALITRAGAPFGESVAWADLAGVPLALLTPDMQNRRLIAGHLAAAGIAEAPGIESNSTIALVSLVLGGGWSTILPLSAAQAFLEHPSLRAVPLVAPDARHRVGLLLPARDPPAPLAAALLEVARTIGRADQPTERRY